MPQRQASSRRKPHKPSWVAVLRLRAAQGGARVPAIAMIIARMSGNEMRGNLHHRSISPDVASLYPGYACYLCSVSAIPLRSAFTIRPIWLPVSSRIAPFWLVSTIACGPRPMVAPTPPAA